MNKEKSVDISEMIGEMENPMTKKSKKLEGDMQRLKAMRETQKGLTEERGKVFAQSQEAEKKGDSRAGEIKKKGNEIVGLAQQREEEMGKLWQEIKDNLPTKEEIRQAEEEAKKAKEAISKNEKLYADAKRNKSPSEEHFKRRYEMSVKGAEEKQRIYETFKEADQLYGKVEKQNQEK